MRRISARCAPQDLRQFHHASHNKIRIRYPMTTGKSNDEIRFWVRVTDRRSSPAETQPNPDAQSQRGCTVLVAWSLSATAKGGKHTQLREFR